MSFVIDLEMLEDAKDLTADDMGAYRSHGTPPEYIYVHFEDKRVKHMICNRKNRLVDEEIERLGLNDAYVFILERKYGKCKVLQDLRRMTVELKMVDNKRNKHFISHKYCLVQYTFNEEDITMSTLFPTEIQKPQVSRIRKQKLVCERIYRTHFEIAA